MALPPATGRLPAVTPAQRRAAVLEEVGGYWRERTGQRLLWRHDVWVDLALTVVARAEATVREGRLITKDEAIGRLTARGVAGWIVEGVCDRRDGIGGRAPAYRRLVPAIWVRRWVAGEIDRLLAASGP